MARIVRLDRKREPTFSPIGRETAGAPSAEEAAWTRNIDSDVATNVVADEGRLVVVVYPNRDSVSVTC